MPPLTAEEEYVIKHKGTEPPFTGRYWKHDECGRYLCRQCGAVLFDSNQKFASECGWPSFDEARPGAVREVPDTDGRRTEILCAACGGHLGHVFHGEGFTDKNTRFCVNSLSMSFEPQACEKMAVEKAVFAGGCFWGVEAAFLAVPGVLNVVSGYTGGSHAAPCYEDVCTGRTGHAEAVEIDYDPARVSYEQLAKLFFEIHDPTQLNRQGPDRGTQYRSAVYYLNEEQKNIAEKLINELKAKGWPVVTELTPFDRFYPAEEYHQRYFEKHGRGACHARVPRFDLSPGE
ncbi:peptide-methionine (S)-S-oxide reductase [Deltaproteobacteria bacterium Smac51]|nr:peptide-methionine (S)-S-oxide reductase [Deltaproteobacteria bacterium Smac51]